jgi:hypothetical protein
MTLRVTGAAFDRQVAKITGLQAKQVLLCRRVTYLSGQQPGIEEIRLLIIWMLGLA